MKADTKGIGKITGMVLVEMVITRSLKMVNLVMAGRNHSHFHPSTLSSFGSAGLAYFDYW